jgi:hypothetical protein
MGKRGRSQRMRERLGGEGGLMLDGRSRHSADDTVVGDVEDCLDGRRKVHILYLGGTDIDTDIHI